MSRFWVVLAAVVVIFSSGHVFAAAAPADDMTSVIAAAQTEGDTANQFLPLLNMLRGLAVVILLICIVGAAMMATWGNSKLALLVGGGAVFLFGAFWVITLVAEAVQKPDSIPELTAIEEPTNTREVKTYGAGAPVKRALNEGLNILTSVTLPFILIYGLWLSLAVAAGESDGAVMRGYVIGAVVALAASILAQAFKII